METHFCWAKVLISDSNSITINTQDIAHDHIELSQSNHMYSITCRFSIITYSDYL